MRCFRKFLVRKKLWKRWGRGEFRYFPSKTFCRKMPKSFARETFICLYFRASKIFMLQRVLSRFSVEFFLSQNAENFRRGILQSVINFGYRKNLCVRVLCHDFPSNFFCLTVPKHFVEEPFCAVFQNLSGSEKFTDKKGGGGLSKFSVGNFLSHSTETLVEEPFSAVFQKIAGSEKFSGEEMGRGEYRKFPSKILCLKMQKTFVGESFSLSLISGIEKNYASEGYFTIFCRSVFVSLPKQFVEEPFCTVFRKNSGGDKVKGKEGGRGVSKFSVEKFLSHSAETLVEEPFSAVFQINAGGEKKIMEKMGERGISIFSVEKFLTQIAETFRRGTLKSFISLGYRKCLFFRGLYHEFLSNFFCLPVPKPFVEEHFCAVFQKLSDGEKVYG